MFSKPRLLIAPLALFFLIVAGTGSATAAPPANDNFSAAQTIGPALPVAVSATTIDATAEVGEPDIGGNDAVATIWFRWTAPANVTAVVDLCEAGFTGPSSHFERMAVRTGASLLAQVLVAQQTGECNVRFNATAGTIYNIQVDYGNDQGNFTFRLRQLAPPSNDNFASSTVIPSALPAQLSGTTLDSGWEAGEPVALGGVNNSRSVWYSWTAPSSGQVRINFCEYQAIVGAANRMLVAYTGNTLATLVTVQSTTNCEMDVPVTSGTVYRIAFSGYIAGEMDFTLRLSDAPPPTNDTFANASVIGPGLPILATGNNDFATIEAGEPGHGGLDPPRHSVWYRWTPNESGPTKVRGCSRDYTGRLSVYTGATLATLVDVGQKPPYAPHCNVILDAVAGTTYSIAVGGGTSVGHYGPFELDLHRLRIPDNDNLDQATQLGSVSRFSTAGTTVDATTESAEPSHDYDYGDRTPSVWYRWTAPDEKPMVVEACSVDEPTRVAVYTGTAYGELEKVVQSATGCRQGTGGRLALAPDPGVSYLIAVSPVARDFETDFTLTGTSPGSAVVKPNPAPKFNLKKAIAKCKKIKGKGKKAKRKRARCIKAARKKAALIKCKKIQNKKTRAKCVRKARKRFK